MKISELAKQLARELRKNQTDAERILWAKLRNKRFAGLKFTRQHPIYYFKDGLKKFIIADFFCDDLKLIIEIDGRIHEQQKDYDKRREELMEIKKFKIIRFKNDDIENNINKSMIELKKFIKAIMDSLK